MRLRRDPMALVGALRMRATLGLERHLNLGDDLPLLWHWAYFPPLAASTVLGEDGHPPRDDEYVERFPRRMAGGGRVIRHRPFILGTPAERHSSLEDRRELTGRSGQMVVATWRHDYYQEDRPVLQEYQHLIYRGPPTESAIPAPRGPDPAAEGSYTDVTSRAIQFNPVLLFMYSAATWNAHRVHYDRPYATEVEGYPGLLVQGPLLATLLAGEAQARLGALSRLEYRAKAPVFDTDVVQVVVVASYSAGLVLEMRKPGGQVTTTLSAHRAVDPETEAGVEDGRCPDHSE